MIPRRPTASLTEGELVKGCLEGKERAQRELYERYAGKMMAVCMRYAADRMEAEDTLHMGFLRVFDKLATFRGRQEPGPDREDQEQGRAPAGASLEGWVRRVFVHVAINRYHSRRRHRMVYVDVLPESSIPTPEITPEALSGLAYADLMAHVQTLPDGARTIFQLYVIDGLDHQQIADSLSISVGTSKSQLSRARRLLQARLGPQAAPRAVNGAAPASVPHATPTQEPDPYPCPQPMPVATGPTADQVALLPWLGATLTS